MAVDINAGDRAPAEARRATRSPQGRGGPPGIARSRRGRGVRLLLRILREVGGRTAIDRNTAGAGTQMNLRTTAIDGAAQAAAFVFAGDRHRQFRAHAARAGRGIEVDGHIRRQDDRDSSPRRVEAAIAGRLHGDLGPDGTARRVGVDIARDVTTVNATAARVGFHVAAVVVDRDAAPGRVEGQMADALAGIDAAATRLDVHVARAALKIDPAAGGVSTDVTLDVCEIKAAAGRVRLHRAVEMRDIDAAAGGLEIDIEPLGHADLEVKFPGVARAEDGAPERAVAAALRAASPDGDSVARLVDGDHMIGEDALFLVLRSGADFAGELDHDLRSGGAGDIDAPDADVDDEIAAGRNIQGSLDRVIGIGEQRGGRGDGETSQQRKAPRREEGDEGRIHGRARLKVPILIP